MNSVCEVCRRVTMSHYIRTCSACGLTYCFDCGVLPRGTNRLLGIVGLVASGGRTVVCPRCNPDGQRGDAR